MEKKENNKLRTEHRLTAVETAFAGFRDEIKDELKDIRENHLKGIYQKLEEIKDKINKRPSWVISGIITLLVALIVYLLTT